MKINIESLEPIFSNALGAIGYDRANKLFFWRANEGIMSTNLIIEGMEEIIRYARNNKIVCGIVDMTKAKGTFTGANSYTKEKFVPAMMPLGYKYVGMITPSDPFTKFATNSMIGLFTPKGLKMKMFSSVNACEEWISEQEEYKEKVI